MTAWTNIQLVMQKARCWQFSFIILFLNYISVSLLSQSQGCIFIICDRRGLYLQRELVVFAIPPDRCPHLHIRISN